MEGRIMWSEKNVCDYLFILLPIKFRKPVVAAFSLVVVNVG